VKLVWRLAPVWVIVVLLVVSGAAPAAASPKIVEPGASPFTVQPAAGGKLQPFTIRASGFQPGQQVYVEQCDGVAITDPHWTPDVDCDIATSPAPVFTPASGTVVFSATDLNHRFTPVQGLSPQGDFACFTATSPTGIPHFDTCKVRISTNNTQATTDQLFIGLSLSGHGGSTKSKSSSGSSSAGILVAVGVVIAALLLAAVFMLRRRRAAV
jgi:hypothetical protein